MSGLFRHEGPVVGVLFGSWPDQVFQLETIKDHPQIFPVIGLDQRLQANEVVIDHFVEGDSDALKLLRGGIGFLEVEVPEEREDILKGVAHEVVAVDSKAAVGAARYLLSEGPEELDDAGGLLGLFLMVLHCTYISNMKWREQALFYLPKLFPPSPAKKTMNEWLGYNR